MKRNDLLVAEPAGIYRRKPPLVVDCSVLAAVLFDEPDREAALAAMVGRELFAPWLLDHEMTSVAVRKTRAGLAEIARRGLGEFAALDLTRRPTQVAAQARLALDQGLSTCDAAYLQLAIEIRAPLATFDQALGRAAVRVLGSG